MNLAIIDNKIKSLTSKTALLVFIVLSLFIFGNSLAGDFVFDDNPIVRDRPELRDITRLPQLLFEPYHSEGHSAGIYRPLTMMSFSLNFSLTGSEPWGFHLINLILHAFAAWLTYLLIGKLLADKALALFCALIFLVLPIHTEPINTIVGRAEMLAMIFSFLSLLVLINNKKEGRISPRLKAAILFLLALLSKESAVGLMPLYFIILLIFYVNKDGLSARISEILKKYWPDFASLSGALIIFLALRAATLDSFLGNSATIVENPLKFAAAPIRIFNAVKVMGMYLIRTIWPVNNLSSDYSFNQIPLTVDWLSPLFWLGVLTLVACFGVLLLALIKKTSSRTVKIISLAAGLFISFFLITSNIVFSIGTIMAERLAYIPSLGVCLLAAALLGYLWKEGEKKYLSLTALVVFFSLFIFYGFLSVDRNSDWASEKALFTSAAEVSPNSVLSRANRGAVYLIDKKPDMAQAEIEAANKIYPDYNHNLNNLGLLYLHQENFEAAKKQFALTLERSPGYGKAIDNLALAYFLNGEYREAKKFWSIIFGNKTADELMAARLYEKLVILAREGKEKEAGNLYELAKGMIGDKKLLRPLKEIIFKQ